jgi:hypothetical protein
MSESNRNLFFRKQRVNGEFEYIIESFDEKGNTVNLGEIAQFQVDGKVKWAVWFYLTHSLLTPWMLRAVGDKIDTLNKDPKDKKAEIKNQKKIRANEKARLSKEAEERNRKK